MLLFSLAPTTDIEAKNAGSLWREPAFSVELLLEIAVVGIVTAVGDGGDGADPAVGVVEEAGNESGLQDLVIVQTHSAELIHLRLVDVPGMSGDVPGILAEGIVHLGKVVLAGAIVVGELIHQLGVLPHTAQVVTMGGEAIAAAVVRGDHNADHFLLGVGEIAGVVIERTLEVQEADVLLGVEGQDLEKVVDEAPVLHHDLNIAVKNFVFRVSHFLAVGLLQAGELFIKFECHI